MTTFPAKPIHRRARAWSRVGRAALALAVLLLALAGDRRAATRAGVRLDLPPLMLWAWDRDDDLRFLDTSTTGVAALAATVTLRGDGVALTPRHNPLALP